MLNETIDFHFAEINGTFLEALKAGVLVAPIADLIPELSAAKPHYLSQAASVTSATLTAYRSLALADSPRRCVAAERARSAAVAGERICRTAASSLRSSAERIEEVDGQTADTIRRSLLTVMDQFESAERELRGLACQAVEIRDS